MVVVRLLVLGVCRRRGRAHGYAIRRELADWRFETWTLVQPGSIYHALKQLAREGRLREAGTEPGARGPGRTLYELSEAGEAEFVALLEAALSSFALDELGAGIAFMDALPRERVLVLLRDLRSRAAATAQGLAGLVPDHADRSPAPHTADLLELWSGSLAATGVFVDALIGRLQAGEYGLAGDVLGSGVDGAAGSTP